MSEYFDCLEERVKGLGICPSDLPLWSWLTTSWSFTCKGHGILKPRSIFDSFHPIIRRLFRRGCTPQQRNYRSNLNPYATSGDGGAMDKKQ